MSLMSTTRYYKEKDTTWIAEPMNLNANESKHYQAKY